MKYLPVFLDVKDKACLVVGAGSVAVRKIKWLLKAGALVRVIATKVSAEVSALPVHYEARNFQDTDLEQVTLVISATDNTALNRHISILAGQKNIPVNVVDNHDLCSFITPAVIEREPIQIAISTDGVAPILSRYIRSKLEPLLPSRYGELAQMIAEHRELVKTAVPNLVSRRRFWESVIVGPIAEAIFSGRTRQAHSQLRQSITAAASVPGDQGEVCLVGAGPGDPDLLTLKALRLMQKCDVVVYDRLVSQSILDLVRQDAEKIDVGKSSWRHKLSQEEINQLLVRLAKSGKCVVRLKGGDPFIFGRGGEEMHQLIAQGIHFQIVPGITAASGCAAYAGIPLTHRDYAQACIFVTGHPQSRMNQLNWEVLSYRNQTLVFYMGLANLQSICDALKAHGRESTTPAAVIEKGTTAAQRVFVGDLDSLPDKVIYHQVSAPALVLVGEVVSLYSPPDARKVANTESHTAVMRSGHSVQG